MQPSLTLDTAMSLRESGIGLWYKHWHSQRIRECESSELKEICMGWDQIQNLQDQINQKVKELDQKLQTLTGRKFQIREYDD